VSLQPHKVTDTDSGPIELHFSQHSARAELSAANESTLSSGRHEVLRGTADTSFSRSARRFSDEPR